MKEIATTGVFQFSVGTDNGRPALFVSVKSEYRSRTVYARTLRREFQQNQKLANDHLLRYIDLRDDPAEGPTIVMEWEDCRPLSAYLKEQHSEDERRDVLEQVAEALGYLHSNGLIHGQLSPDVVLITTKGDRVKLLNFRQHYIDSLREPRDLTRYRSPEAKDNTTQLSATTDIYSLGMMMRDLGLEESYPQVVATCLSTNRSSRYSTTDELIYALDHRSRRSSGGGGRVGMPRVSRRAVVVLLCIAAIVVAAILVVPNIGKLNLLQGGQEQDTVAVSASDPVKAQPAAAKADTLSYTGDMAFLADLVPQMKIDLDKIYDKALQPDATPQLKRKARLRAQRYYKGLRRTLKQQNLSPEQYAAFDKAFGDYNAQKLDSIN